jgi:hypothetical protein
MGARRLLSCGLGSFSTFLGNFGWMENNEELLINLRKARLEAHVWASIF